LETLWVIGLLAITTEEGYIRHAGSIGQEAIELATLTQTSFAHLSGRPYQVEKQQDSKHPAFATLAGQLHHAVTQGTSNEVSHLVQKLLSQLCDQ
jgi:hypothetical protein